MTTTGSGDSKVEFPRDRLSPISTEADFTVNVVAAGEKPRRQSFFKIFLTMSLMVKLAALWLIFIVGLALYAKLDTAVFNGALPLQDPNFQTNRPLLLVLGQQVWSAACNLQEEDTK